MQIHIVQRGETLLSVARRYSVDPEILAFNNDIETETLVVGQPLVIVTPTLTHIVSRGETLQSIAERYNTPIYDLWRRNLFLNGRDEVFAGQILYITTERSQPLGTFQVGGYAYPFIDPLVLDRTLPIMSSLIPFTYGFRPDGSLVLLNDSYLLSRAAVYGNYAIMHLSTLTENDVFSTELATQLFGDQALQDKLIDNAIRNIEQKGYKALDVDFEFLGLENSLLYADFVAKVRDRLAPLGVPVMAALAPKTSTTQRGILYEGHDYSALGNAADALLLMTYEWGYTYGPPLAVSPIEQVEDVVKFAITQIEPSKLYLGISNYGYNFVLPYVRGESKANSLSTAEAFALAAREGSEIQYDETAQAPFFNYTDEVGRAHTVWFEDVRSISARLELIERYGLRGALYWNLNRRNNQNLVLIEQRVNPEEFSLMS